MRERGHGAPFGLEWTSGGTRLTDSPVRDRPGVVGRFTPREEALGLQDTGRLWHVVDHVALDDPRPTAVGAWLDAA